MDDWRGFVQTFFDALHWAWMDGKPDRLAPFFTQESWKGKTDWQPVVSRLLDEREPEANIYAVSGRVIPICWLERERDIQASFLWRGWCHSRIGETRKVGETKRWLTIHLAKNGESWTIQEIYEWRQGRQGKEPEPGTGQGEGSEPEPGSIQVNGQHPPATESRLPVPEPCAGVEDAEEMQAKPVLSVYGASGYNPGQAVAYAEHYWNSSNPAYPLFQDDCTNFISQCLHAGGIPMLFSKDKTRGWWMRTGKDAVWSYSWSVAHSLYLLLKSGAPPMRAQQKNGPEELVPGDVICYDFDGDGRFQHNTIVVAKDASNMPLVNAHSSNSRMRFWAYLDSTAYTPNIRYAFFHIRGL